LRTFGLYLLLLLGAAYLAVSFQPRVRFADPAPHDALGVSRSFHCYHDKIYGNSPGLNVLLFGASRTHNAVDANSIAEIYERVTGKSLAAFTFDLPGANSSLRYLFFREYLERNPAPEMAFFELTANAPDPYSPVKYVHMFFPDVAPPDLYLDVLRSWDQVVPHKLFAVSDFLRLHIRHIDLSFSRLLVADSWFMVPPGDNCEHPAPGDPGFSLGDPGRNSFAQLLDAEMERLLPPFDRAEVGGTAALLETYAEDPLMRATIERANKRLPKRRQRPFWRDRETKQRNLEYYRRIVALAEAHDVKVAFYHLPTILAPEPREEDIRQLSDSLGAPVYVLPYWFKRISYHYYKDSVHVAPAMRPAYSIWFAGLIDQVRSG
jgi:hypothetical protein